MDVSARYGFTPMEVAAMTVPQFVAYLQGPDKESAPTLTHEQLCRRAQRIRERAALTGRVA